MPTKGDGQTPRLSRQADRAIQVRKSVTGAATMQQYGGAAAGTEGGEMRQTSMGGDVSAVCPLESKQKRAMRPYFFEHVHSK